MNRNQRRRLAAETIAVLDAGYYEVGDERIEIRSDLQAACDGTVDYPPESSFPESIATARHDTVVQVRNTGTLDAARDLAETYSDVCALNFASAYSPGGGFRSGAQAQEEALARVSGLYASLKGSGMYAYHRALSDDAHSDYAVYSPNVPVFRTDAGDLLAAPWLCNFVSSPAPRTTRLAKQGRAHEARPLVKRRIRRVLAIMAHHGHTAIVLGAWGCGVFGNDPNVVADEFASALDQEFAGVFQAIEFAVLDFGQPAATFEAFRRRLA